MIYEKETWDWKTQAMGQFKLVNQVDGSFGVTFVRLEERVIVSETVFGNGRYSCYYVNRFCAYFYSNPLWS